MLVLPSDENKYTKSENEDTQYIIRTNNCYYDDNDYVTWQEQVILLGQPTLSICSIS